MKKKDPTSHRIIEKRRRDRMNNCLADLSKLIPPHYLKKGKGRIEKTEIIEMAIRHLKDLIELSNGQQSQISHHKTSLDADPAADSRHAIEIDVKPLSPTFTSKISSPPPPPPPPQPATAVAATGAVLHKHEHHPRGHSGTCHASSIPHIQQVQCSQQAQQQKHFHEMTTTNKLGSPRRHPTIVTNGFQQCPNAAELQDCVAHARAGVKLTSNLATAHTSTAIRMMQNAHHHHHHHSAHGSGSSSSSSSSSTSRSYHHHHHHHHYLSGNGGPITVAAATATATGGPITGTSSSRGGASLQSDATTNTGTNLHKYRTSQGNLSSSSSGSDSSSSGSRSSGSRSSGNRSNGNSSSGTSGGHRSPGSNSNSAKYSSSGATGGSHPPGSGPNSVIVGGVNANQQNDNDNNGGNSSSSSSSSSSSRTSLSSMSSQSGMRAATLSSHRTSSGFGSSSSETTNQATSRVKLSPNKMTMGNMTDIKPNISEPIECCTCGSIIVQPTGEQQQQQQPPLLQVATNAMTQTESDDNNRGRVPPISPNTRSDKNFLDFSSSSSGSDNESGAGNNSGANGDNTGSNSGSASDSAGSDKNGSGSNSTSSSCPSSSSSSPQSSTSSSSSTSSCSSAAWFKKAWLVRSFSRSPPNR